MKQIKPKQQEKLTFSSQTLRKLTHAIDEETLKEVGGGRLGDSDGTRAPTMGC